MLYAYENSIEKAFGIVENNVDSLIERSESMLFPLGANLLRSLDGFRHNIVEIFPKTLGRFFSDAMMEHYRTGLNEIIGHFDRHMQTILAPIDALVGPFKAIIKSNPFF